jgi:ubiquinone biosynthesis protein UbiJ
MPSVSGKLIVLAINHLIVKEAWASARLRPFAGQIARIQAQPFKLNLAIRSDGLFDAMESVEQTPAVSIVLPDDAAGKLITGDMAAIFASARISGSAEFAEALAFVFRNLRWDAEADLAAMFGDIAAHRGFQLAQSLLTWQKSAAFNVAQNVKEYLSEETGSVADRQEICAFSCQIKTLRDDLARLEKRIAKL